jgi:hypothetical protein
LLLLLLGLKQFGATSGLCSLTLKTGGSSIFCGRLLAKSSRNNVQHEDGCHQEQRLIYPNTKSAD